MEGPEGAGKTVQKMQFIQWLKDAGHEVISTREPGGTDIGDQVRSVLMKLDNTAMHPRTETLLFQAARAQLVEEVIRPGLLSGKIVLCDRFADSTLAYQGYGHGVEIDTLRKLIEFATDGLKPDVTLLLALDPEIGLSRKRESVEWNRLDAQELAFHQRVYRGYLKLAAQEPERYRVVDASKSIGEVQQEMRDQFMDYQRLRAVGMVGLVQSGWLG